MYVGKYHILYMLRKTESTKHKEQNLGKKPKQAQETSAPENKKGTNQPQHRSHRDYKRDSLEVNPHSSGMQTTTVDRLLCSSPLFFNSLLLLHTQHAD